MDEILVQEALGETAYLQSPEAEPDPDPVLDPDSVRSIAVMMNLAKSPLLKQSAKGDRFQYGINFKKAQFKKMKKKIGLCLAAAILLD